jgi:hypothetical protein
MLIEEYILFKISAEILWGLILSPSGRNFKSQKSIIFGVAIPNFQVGDKKTLK